MKGGWIDAHYVYDAEWISDPTFLYPIQLAMFFVPLGILDLYDAFVLWDWLSQTLLLLAVLLLLPLFGGARKHYVLPIALGILLYRPSIPLLFNGQLSAFFLLIIILVGGFWEKEHWIWGGMLASLLFLKPNLGGPILVLLGLYLVIQKKFRGILGIGLGTVILLIIGWVYDPDWVGTYLHVLQSKHSLTFGLSATVWGLSALICDFKLYPTLIIGSIIVLLVLILYFLLLTKVKEITPLTGVAISISTALLVTPYLWPYDQVLLFLPIILIMAILKNSGFPYLGTVMVFIGIDIAAWILFGISARRGMENLNALLSVIVFGLQAFLLFRNGCNLGVETERSI